jgi:hypothetical protein
MSLKNRGYGRRLVRWCVPRLRPRPRLLFWEAVGDEESEFLRPRPRLLFWEAVGDEESGQLRTKSRWLFRQDDDFGTRNRRRQVNCGVLAVQNPGRNGRRTQLRPDPLGAKAGVGETASL